MNARELFARNGIGKTSIRSIAAAAGVDSALVHHYFGTKEQLFAAAVHIPIDPMLVIGPMREIPVDELGLTLPSLLLPLWDSEIGSGFIATMRSLLAGRRRRPDPVVPAGRHHRRNRFAGRRPAGVGSRSAFSSWRRSSSAS